MAKDSPRRETMPGYVLGLDGGQSVTLAAVCDLQGRLLGLGRAGPANHVWEPGGRARARRAVAGSVKRALRAARLGAVRFEAAFLGITGATDHTRRAVEDCVDARRLRIANDKVNALASVTEGGPGVVVIAGTGAIAYGENRKGEAAEASGWGYLFGDEGSGFWIARESLAAASRAYDGRGEPTALVEAIARAAGVEDLWDLHAQIYSGQLSRPEIARLALAAAEAAEGGDRTARAVLHRAGRELGLAGGAVARKLGMRRGRVVVGMVGGVFDGSPVVRASFRREVRRHAPGAEIVRPRYAPVIGSALLALKMTGVRLGAEVKSNLAAASASVGVK